MAASVRTLDLLVRGHEGASSFDFVVQDLQESGEDLMDANHLCSEVGRLVVDRGTNLRMLVHYSVHSPTRYGALPCMNTGKRRVVGRSVELVGTTYQPTSIRHRGERLVVRATT